VREDSRPIPENNGVRRAVGLVFLRAAVRVRRLTIQNFRAVAHGVVDFRGHTLLVGGNNVGKSTICDALELVLGPERLFRRPIVDEHDFHNGHYLDAEGNRVEIRIEAVLLDLHEDTQRKLFGRTRPWSERRGGFVDVEGAEPAHLDEADVCRALPVVFIGWYDRANDEFSGQTYFAHPVEQISEDDDRFSLPGAGLHSFDRNWKLACGFIYLRTLRTGRRALSLERGSLLDTILRLGDNGRESMWEATLESLRELEPPIGQIPQLDAIRARVRERMARFVGIAEGDDATGFFASELTREHLREVVSFFVRSQDSSYLVPFHRLGTGSINTLVFALLTHIADLRGAQSVIFAMEEPEIALPPHSQRRITRYLRRHMGQAIVTSHSPYVIEEFELDEILSVMREDARLTGNFVPTQDLRARTLKRHRRQLAEAVLARGVIVAEGISECAALATTSEKLEQLAAAGAYAPLDLTGVSLFDAGGAGEVSKWGPFFAALGKKAFAFYDKRTVALSAEEQGKLAAYAIKCETRYRGLEEFLVHQIPVAVMRRFLDTVSNRADRPPTFPTNHESLSDDKVMSATKAILIQKKGEGWCSQLIEQCTAVAELPATMLKFLADVYDLMKLPDLHEEPASDTPSGASNESP
jgi:putative ATP-dependent endonuclease of OLD family